MTTFNTSDGHKNRFYCSTINWCRNLNQVLYIFPVYLVARFMDNEWYRAEIQQVISQDKFLVHYVDYGNSQALTPDKIAKLPDQFAALPPQAKEFQLFLTVPPQDVSCHSGVISNGLYRSL